MTQQIYTKLHEALSSPVTLTNGGTVAGAEAERAVLQRMATLPHFVLDRSLLVSMDLVAIMDSVWAINQAGLLSLPFPEVLIELSGGVPDFRFFAAITQGPDDPTLFSAVVVEWVNGELWPHPFEASIRCFDPNSVDGTSFRTEYSDPTEPPRKDIINRLCAAIPLCLMLTNISGLERELVEPRRLNKHRLASGKAPIPTHTVVRIGHVYDSRGRRVRYDAGDANRKPTAVHMRAAHIRWQHHGPAWRAEHPDRAALPGNTEDGHRVLIDAVLVNYRDGTDLKKPLPKVVRF